MSGPAGRVFAIPELCVPILHGLATKDLLLAQRVCKRWKSTIENSQKLQRALFFQPVDLPLVRGKPRLPLSTHFSGTGSMFSLTLQQYPG